ncbi:class I SAM-dependent methyltransferase [Allofranklinella schreckenbergeri]|uniref:Class I SAM-dependent methyltransferase n=1 Tax=Allofranklinella schreckenbergeri TaxID=1076744 RepID=A0A3M6QVP9_9BURK|nr:class I SAM-dependent methyltransferase [Allofranklinella schreckenbergeri]RMX07095.1 class I SAM-dependent methyltransferase [Allofranklinella schreckenbergeri]
MKPITPGLSDVPETMLWTLHNRASEAARPDGCIRDPQCLEIYRAIDYDYERSFGRADPSHGVRSQLCDARLREFLAEHPDGVIVNLGEGLETQRFRIDAPQALWLSIDLPEAIAVRERFIQPDAQHLHIARSALDTAWFDAVPPGRAVFICAQGLFMYLREQEVAQLVSAMAARFPGAILMFDYLNRALSRRTLSQRGWMKTRHYRTPPMPWGIDRDQLAPSFSRWIGQPVKVHNVTFLFPRGPLRWLIPLLEKTPLGHKMPGLCWLRLPGIAGDTSQVTAAAKECPTKPPPDPHSP